MAERRIEKVIIVVGLRFFYMADKKAFEAAAAAAAFNATDNSDNRQPTLLFSLSLISFV